MYLWDSFNTQCKGLQSVHNDNQQRLHLVQMILLSDSQHQQLCPKLVLKGPAKDSSWSPPRLRSSAALKEGSPRKPPAGVLEIRGAFNRSRQIPPRKVDLLDSTQGFLHNSAPYCVLGIRHWIIQPPLGCREPWMVADLCQPAARIFS